MTLEDAKHYIHYCIKEGGLDAEKFIGMSDSELIEWAEKESDRGDAMAEAMSEEQA